MASPKRLRRRAHKATSEPAPTSAPTARSGDLWALYGRQATPPKPDPGAERKAMNHVLGALVEPHWANEERSAGLEEGTGDEA